MQKLQTLICTVSFFLAANAQAEMVQATRDSICVRQSAGGESTILAGLNPGDQVKLLGKTGKWYKVQLPNGVIGFAFHRFFAPVKASVSKPAEGKASRPLRTVELAKKEEDSGQLKRLQAKIDSKDVEIKSLKQEVSQLTEQVTAERKAKDEALSALTVLKESLFWDGNGKLIAVVDEAGEKVFLKGVGEVVMATVSESTVIKLPASREANADRVFASIRAEKIAHNGFLYYVASSKALSW